MNRLQRFSLHNPRDINEAKYVKKFYAKVHDSKAQLLAGDKLPDTNSVKVAKSFNDAHRYHELFNNAKDDFKAKENPTFKDLAKLLNKAKSILSRAESLKDRLDG